MKDKATAVKESSGTGRKMPVKPAPKKQENLNAFQSQLMELKKKFKE